MTKSESDAAKLLGRKGGRSKSEAKQNAARENGKKGGPKKYGITQPITYPSSKSSCCGAPIVEHDDMLCLQCGHPCSPRDKTSFHPGSDRLNGLKD